MSCDLTQTIFILIEDEDLSMLFAELVKAHGNEVRIVRSEQHLPAAAKVLTEPKYYPSLSADQQKGSLVVGNKTALEQIATATLSRPLTEHKIINALESFLTGS